MGSSKGIEQECTLSPLFFSIYTENLAAKIKALGLVFRVGRDGGLSWDACYMWMIL